VGLCFQAVLKEILDRWCRCQDKHIGVFTFFKKFQGLLCLYKRLWYEAFGVSILFNCYLGASVNSIS